MWEIIMLGQIGGEPGIKFLPFLVNTESDATIKVTAIIPVDMVTIQSIQRLVGCGWLEIGEITIGWCIFSWGGNAWGGRSLSWSC